MITFVRKNLAKFPYKSSAKHIILLWTNFVVILASTIFLTLFLRHYLLPGEISAEFPLNFLFKTCNEKQSGVCSYPEAYVNLFKPNGDLLIESGVGYDVNLEVDFSDSAANRQSGMFMTILKMEKDDNSLYKMYQKSALIPYRSKIVGWIRTVLMLPFFLFDFSAETVTINVHFVSDFRINSYDSITKARVEIQHANLDIIGARLKFLANLRGVRYFVNYWPITSTILLFSLIFACLFSVTFVYYILKAIAVWIRQGGMANLADDDFSDVKPVDGKMKNEKIKDKEKTEQKKKIKFTTKFPGSSLDSPFLNSDGTVADDSLIIGLKKRR